MNTPDRKWRLLHAVWTVTFGWTSASLAADCNSNGVDDAIDIASFTSLDCNSNSAPDECEFGCPCADIVILRDVTGSEAQQFNAINNELVDFTSSAVAQWGSDLRLGLITFDGVVGADFVTVVHPLTEDHAAVVSYMQEDLHTGDGGGAPEASDEALRVMLGGLSECVGTQGFDVPFRAHCTKHAILVTDDVPGGCDDVYSIGLDDVNAHQRAVDAATTGIRIQAVFTGTDATARAIMEDYAEVTGGTLYEGEDIPELLAELLSEQVMGVACRGLEDCDENDLLDECDVAGGFKFDCNEDGRLDVCELSAGTAFDCDSDGELDECEIDCDTNGVADVCEPGPVLFVDASVQGGAGNGFTWEDAFPLLQDALAAAANCRFTQIWVADGTYFPDEGAAQTLGDRNATFNLMSRVGIYGGFAGGESLLTERDVAANPTILSGDISAGTLDSVHVVTADNGVDGSAILDGFTITGGRADVGVGDSGSGAGLLVSNDASPSVFQCTFDGNYALVVGGAAFVRG